MVRTHSGPPREGVTIFGPDPIDESVWAVAVDAFARIGDRATSPFLGTNPQQRLPHIAAPSTTHSR